MPRVIKRLFTFAIIVAIAFTHFSAHVAEAHPVFARPGLGASVKTDAKLPDAFEGCWWADVIRAGSGKTLSREASHLRLWWPETVQVCFTKHGQGGWDVSYWSSAYDGTPLGRLPSPPGWKPAGPGTLKFLGKHGKAVELRFDADCSTPESPPIRVHRRDTILLTPASSRQLRASDVMVISHDGHPWKETHWHAVLSNEPRKVHHAANPLAKTPAQGWTPDEWAQLKAFCQSIADQRASGRQISAFEASNEDTCKHPPEIPQTEGIATDGSPDRELIAAAAVALPAEPARMFGPDTWRIFRGQCLDLAKKVQKGDKLTADERIDALMCRAGASDPSSVIPYSSDDSSGRRFWEIPIFPPPGWELQQWFAFARRCQDVLDKINQSAHVSEDEFIQMHVCVNFAWHGRDPASVQVPRWVLADRVPTEADLAGDATPHGHRLPTAVPSHAPSGQH